MRREIAEGCQVPGRTDQGLKTPRRSAGRRCRVLLSPGDPGDKPRLVDYAPFGAPLPLTRGGKPKAQLAWTRENADPCPDRLAASAQTMNEWPVRKSRK